MDKVKLYTCHGTNVSGLTVNRITTKVIQGSFQLSENMLIYFKDIVAEFGTFSS